jgi:hypothetical protein
MGFSKRIRRRPCKVGDILMVFQSTGEVEAFKINKIENCQYFEQTSPLSPDKNFKKRI